MTDCDIASICGTLASPNGAIGFWSNAVGCNTKEEVIEACLTGVHEDYISTGKFEIFPNPTNKWLKIKSLNPTSSYNFEIRNLMGQLVREENYIQLSQHTMNIADLKSGVYFYRIKENGEILQQGKLIIKR